MKSYPTDRNQNEQDSVYTFYFNFNKYMKGMEVEYLEDGVAAQASNILRNGYFLCLYAEDRSHTNTGTLIGSANFDKIPMAANKWSYSLKYKLRFMDSGDNMRPNG